jgi:uncharacterized protein (TIGR03086 family)
MTQTAPPLTDPRPLFARTVATAVACAAGVRPDQLESPTPCTEYDVRHLLGHLVAVVDRVAAVGRGEDPFSVPIVAEGVPDDGWPSAVTAAAQRMGEVWADDAVLDRPLRLPFGTLPGAAALASYAGEITTHTWDVAVATGQVPEWDPDVLAVAVTAIQEKLPSAERGPQIPFADAVPVAADASLIDQLVAWQGRDPGWTAPARADG